MPLPPDLLDDDEPDDEPEDDEPEELDDLEEDERLDELELGVDELEPDELDEPELDEPDELDDPELEELELEEPELEELELDELLGELEEFRDELLPDEDDPWPRNDSESTASVGAVGPAHAADRALSVRPAPPERRRRNSRRSLLFLSIGLRVESKVDPTIHSSALIMSMRVV